METKPIGLIAGAALAGAALAGLLILGGAGLAMAQDPPATSPPGGGMMGGGYGTMGGGYGTMGSLTDEQLEQMQAMHANMPAAGYCDPAGMGRFGMTRNSR